MCVFANLIVPSKRFSGKQLDFVFIFISVLFSTDYQNLLTFESENYAHLKLREPSVMLVRACAGNRTGIKASPCACSHMNFQMLIFLRLDWVIHWSSPGCQTFNTIDLIHKRPMFSSRQPKYMKFCIYRRWAQVV